MCLAATCIVSALYLCYDMCSLHNPLLVLHSEGLVDAIPGASYTGFVTLQLDDAARPPYDSCRQGTVTASPLGCSLGFHERQLTLFMLPYHCMIPPCCPPLPFPNPLPLPSPFPYGSALVLACRCGRLDMAHKCKRVSCAVPPAPLLGRACFAESPGSSGPAPALLRHPLTKHTPAGRHGVQPVPHAASAGGGVSSVPEGSHLHSRPR